MVPLAPQQKGTKKDMEENPELFESDEQYQAREDAFNASGGYGPMVQMQTSEGQAAMLEGLDGKASSVGGGYGKKRVGEQSRGQMNLTAGQGRSILTGA